MSNLTPEPKRPRRRCPRCGGPAVMGVEPPPGEARMAVCINCDYEFPYEQVEGSAGAAFRLPSVLLIGICFVGAGLGVGLLVAALASVENLGGWILVALGVGMVVAMGAVEAGYLEGPRKKLLALLGRTNSR